MAASKLLRSLYCQDLTSMIENQNLNPNGRSIIWSESEILSQNWVGQSTIWLWDCESFGDGRLIVPTYQPGSPRSRPKLFCLRVMVDVASCDMRALDLRALLWLSAFRHRQGELMSFFLLSKYRFTSGLPSACFFCFLQRPASRFFLPPGCGLQDCPSGDCVTCSGEKCSEDSTDCIYHNSDRCTGLIRRRFLKNHQDSKLHSKEGRPMHGGGTITSGCAHIHSSFYVTITMGKRI